LDDKIIMAIVGIIGGLIAFLQKVLYGQGQRLEGIVVKLIDRFNKSDARLEDVADELKESADRRHEKVISELNKTTDELAYIKGRMNGK